MYQALVRKRIFLPGSMDGHLVINQQHKYHYQVQQQMFVTQKSWVDLVVKGVKDLPDRSIEGFGGKRVLGFLLKSELCQKRSKFRMQLCLPVSNNVLHVFSLKFALFSRYYVCKKTVFVDTSARDHNDGNFT